jgi:transcriptional regulator with XRE-family HTH domain
LFSNFALALADFCMSHVLLLKFFDSFVLMLGSKHDAFPEGLNLRDEILDPIHFSSALSKALKLVLGVMNNVGESGMSKKKIVKEGIGKRLRSLRESHSMTSSAVAKHLNVTPAAVWHWENAGTVPRADKLDLIARTFKVTRAYLETGDDPAASAACEQHAPAPVVQMNLEELMRAIESMGFDVFVSPKQDPRIVPGGRHRPVLRALNGRSH